MHVCRLGSFPIEQEALSERLERRLAEWFVGNDYSARLLAYSRSFDTSELVRALRRDLRPIAALEQATRGLVDEIAALAAGAAGADPALALQQMPAGEQALLERWFEGVEPVLAAIADAREGRPVPAEDGPVPLPGESGAAGRHGTGSARWDAAGREGADPARWGADGRDGAGAARAPHGGPVGGGDAPREGGAGAPKPPPVKTKAANGEGARAHDEATR